jgi:hypothetical protein
MSCRKKKLIREGFRSAVFDRDLYKCVKCGAVEGLDAHHITDRSLMPNGGYVKENGISLCPNCHNVAETYHRTGGAMYVFGFHPDDLYRMIGSSKELAKELSKGLMEDGLLLLAR